MRDKFIIIKGIFAFLLAVNVSGFLELSARNVEADSLSAVGDSLRARYEFDASLASYKAAMKSLTDSSGEYTDSAYVVRLVDKMLMSENGRNMSQFVSTPEVVARHRFSISDFFLYYPLADNSWRSVPNQLDSVSSHPFSKAVYVPEGVETIYYSSVDEAGVRNICKTELLDTVWSSPSLINEQLTSSSDEIYPMLSPDGRSLYFASSGLYGVGGYDLYVSRWDDETADWSSPVNLGFPYSSPANDFLLINTDDGRHTIFASDRGCEGDSVCVYVLEYDSMPVRKAVGDPSKLCEIAQLNPSDRTDGEGRDVNADIPENVDTKKYMDKMSEVRALRDSLSLYETALEESRNQFILSSDADERILLTNRILKLESSMPAIQDSLTRATDILRKIEMEFLFNGVVIDPDKLMAAADREVVGEATRYAFVKMSPGQSLSMNILPPPVKFDYTFKVMEEGQFALDNNLPEGLVYQIQMFSLARKATIKDIKGLSPVFEHKTSSGRYVYRVGLFRSYKDVLSKLNKVKRVGFRSAFIVAFNDGKELSVSKARTLEAELKAKPVFYEVRISPEGGALDEAEVAGITQQASGKDVARIEGENGRTVYVIGPYNNKESADSLVAFAKAMGIAGVEMKTINN